MRDVKRSPRVYLGVPTVGIADRDVDARVDPEVRHVTPAGLNQSANSGYRLFRVLASVRRRSHLGQKAVA